MVDHQLKGPMLRIERANEFIAEFRGIQDAFLADHPIRIFTELHPDGRHKTVKLRLTRTLPDRASILVGDACSSLRSALDQLTVSLAKLNGATTNSNIYFPIAGSLKEFQSPGTQTKIRKLAPDAIDLIAAFKPYKGGNNDLWSLSKLRVKDFHHDLIAVLAECMPLIERPEGIFDWHRSVERAETSRFGGFPWDFVNNGMDVAIVAKDVPIEDKISVSLNVMFREPDTLEGLPVLDKLYDFSRLVERILLTVQKRFFF